MTAVRALLEQIVDYAGLFPPAGLSMAHAIENYADYANGPRAWMLGKFVLTASRLPEFVKASRALPVSADARPFELSLIIGADVDDDVKRARKFINSTAGFGEVRSLEVKAGSPDAVRDVALITEELPEVFEVFVELPPDAPRAMIAQVGAMGLCAKLRTGGVTADAFPTAKQIVTFMRECVDTGTPFKATAGLHHPICARYPLTYDDNAESAPMFGFLNVFLAAAILGLRGGDDDALGVLEERDANAFRFTPDAVTWRDVRLTTAALQRLRTRTAMAFGSCSFTEPVADLERMGVLT